MGIGRIIGAAAPIAAGYFGGPALAGTFGGATGGAIAAGAMTGAGIAALSGDDLLGGAITGGLGGMTGGGLNTAIQKASLSPGMTTGQLNKELLSPYTQAGGSLAGKGVGQASTMTAADATSGLATGGGYNPATGSFGASPVSNIAYTGQTSAVEPIQNALSRSTVTPSISDVAREFGGGSEAMGYGKMGIAGLGVAGQAGAFDPEPIKLSDSRDKYDPRRRLDLSMDTGIDEALNRDTGLRLLAQGGKVQNYFMGGPMMEPPPVYGIIDVGGNFVETSKKPGPGLISDKDFKEQYQTTTADKNQQGGGGGGMDPNLSPTKAQGEDGGISPGAISALAAGFAQQQMNPPTKDQTLGLSALAGGGRIKGYANGGYATLLEAAQAMDKMYPKSTTDNKGRTRYSNIGSALLAFAEKHGANIGQPSADTSSYDYALNLNTGKQEALAGGGYLETGGEVGDGMSDEIEATIEGTQEARLSDGEFVVPADVVSHLGNGSSDAGAKRLYEMMDKIRMARTGTKKQGKEINPERYMPA